MTRYHFDFTKMPYDVLQWEINNYLTFLDRASLNSVLQWQERVYKRFPKGFVERHARRTAIRSQNLIVAKMNREASKFEYEQAMGANQLLAENSSATAFRAIVYVGMYADFLMKPVAKPLFTLPIAKEAALLDLNILLSDEYIFSDYMTTAVRFKIMQAIQSMK